MNREEQMASNKIKINDYNKLVTVKSIIEQLTLETQAEFTKEDIIKIFEPYFENKIELDIFHGVIDSMKDEFVEKFKKKLKSQMKILVKFFNKNCEEETYVKESETKIYKEEKKVELEKAVEEKMKGIIQLVTRVKESKEKSKEFYHGKSNVILENNNLKMNQLEREENIIINKRDESNNLHCLSLPDVVDFFAGNRTKLAKDLIKETFSLYNETQSMQRQVAEDYVEIEKQFIEQERYLEILKNAKVQKERNLFKNNILF